MVNVMLNAILGQAFTLLWFYEPAVLLLALALTLALLEAFAALKKSSVASARKAKDLYEK